IPEGTRCSTVFLPPITRVWPALCPPWKRTTPWAWSVSQSTTLPLPSSPHCVPMTTTFLPIGRPLFEFSHDPFAVALRELAIALRLRRLGGVPRERDHDDLSRVPQLAHRGRETGVARVRRADRVLGGPWSRRAREITQIHAESGGRPSAPECLADFVIAPAERYRIGDARRVGRKYGAAVVVIPAKVREIDRHRNSAFAGEG